MTPTHDTPLTNEAAWLDGVWIRGRSGPTKKAYTDEATVTVWHKVGGLSARWPRLQTYCGYGPREGFLWPSAGSRLEIARPGPYASLPGSVCRRCLDLPVMAEGERVIPDEVDIDHLATLVAEHLLAKGTIR